MLSPLSLFSLLSPSFCFPPLHPKKEKKMKKEKEKKRERKGSSPTFPGSRSSRNQRKETGREKYRHKKVLVRHVFRNRGVWMGIKKAKRTQNKKVECNIIYELRRSERKTCRDTGIWTHVRGWRRVGGHGSIPRIYHTIVRT
jgi:hypothetical protein